MATLTEAEAPAEAGPAAQTEEGVARLGAEATLAEIKRNCVIMYVTVKAWRGQYLMRNADLVIGGRKVDEKLATRGQWKVIPDKWHKALQPFESRCRAAVYRAGVAFKDGVYVVPKSRAQALVAEIRRVRDQYRAKAAEFAAEWPALVEQLGAKLVAELGDDQWLAVSRLLPSAAALPRLFDIEVGLWPVGGDGAGEAAADVYEDLAAAAAQLEAVDALAAGLRDPGPLARFAAAVRAAWGKASRGARRLSADDAADWLAEAQAATNRMVASAVEAMVAEPVKEFAEQVDNLARLSQARTVRAGTLDAVRRAYDKLVGFQFMLPADLTDRLRQVAVRLGAADPQSMNGRTVAGEGLNSALRAIREDLAAEVATLDAFGQLTRHLDV